MIWILFLVSLLMVIYTINKLAKLKKNGSVE